VALTADQRASVRRYLGYPDRIQGYYSLLEGSMDSLSAAGETQLVSLLTKLASLETRLESFWATSNLKRAEEVEFFEGGHRGLLTEGERLVRQLSQLLNIAIEASAFSSGASGGPTGRG
jgi:hypothetical protein